MAEVGEKGELQRPYTLGTFQNRLNKFHKLIYDITYQDAEATPEERRQWITENLRYDQFCEKIRDLFGSDIRNQDLKALYRKISTNPDAKVDWSELFGYFQSGAEEEEITVGEEVSVFMISKRRRVGEAAGDRKRRDTVQCLKYIPALDAYLSASQKGAISIWTSKLRLQGCIDIHEAAWVTGCDYLPSIRRVACCTERSIAIWDNRSKGKNQHIFIIKPIEDSPQCMTTLPSYNTHEDKILFGDDQGYVNVMTIAAKDLTMKNSKGEKRNSQTYTIEPNKMTHPIQRRKLHDDWVLKVKYFPELRCFGSCSPSSNQSFVLEEVERLFDNGEVRGVAIPKGVNCFDYCARANIIATGGVDKIIRVWHPHIFSRPTGKLLGHLFTIIDIACNERDQHIISLSTARVFRVWDIHTLTCLQVFTDNEERPGEKRIYAMMFDNKHENMLTGSSVIDSWPLTRAVQDTMQVPHTHDRPIAMILYNKELHQVVSVCAESVIKVWEMETGKLVYALPEAHGSGVEVTAIALDKSGYRLVSGAIDGSIKVWDFGAGQMIKSRPGRTGDEDLSIVGLVYFKYKDDHAIIAAGWNNKLKFLLDAQDSNDLQVLHDFNDVFYYMAETELSLTPDPFKGQPPLPDIGTTNPQLTSVFKKSYVLTSHEIMCMCNISQDVIATGCANGNVIFWDIEKSSVEKIFELPAGDSETGSAHSQARREQSGDVAVHAVRVLVHRVRKLDPAYIKKLTGFHHTDDDDLRSEMMSARGSTFRLSRMSGASRRSNHPPAFSQEQQEDAERMLQELTLKVEGDDAAPKSSRDVTARSQLPTPTPRPEDEDMEKGQKESEERKSVDHNDDDDLDPDAHMIVETFDPVVVTIHQDSYIRFWNMKGDVLREISAMTRRQGSAVTAICHDEDVNILVTGDHKGYLTQWDVRKFLENPESQDPDNIKQMVCWRAHLTRVTSLVYVDSAKSILSGSSDGSVRVWWGSKGRFIGFFSQHRPFNFPANEETAGTPTLPYDINEGPLAPVRRKSASQKIRAVQQKFEYPLMFDKDKWTPFRRSAYFRTSNTKQQPEDKKFFAALIKPKAYNHHLESFTTGEKKQGAVFRALPVYKVTTPEKPKTPDISFKMTDDDEGYSAPGIFGVATAMGKGTQVGFSLLGRAKSQPEFTAGGSSTSSPRRQKPL